MKINSYSDCSCLYRASDSDPYTRKSSGSFDQSSSFYMTTKGEAPLDTPVEFIPTAIDFPQGIYVYSKDYTFNGQIRLEYETVMSLYNVKEGSFTKGDAVFQSSTGATGTVYESTKSRIFGLEMNWMSPPLTQSYVWSSDCSSSSNSNPTSWFDAGTIITQKQVTTTGSGTKGAITITVSDASNLKKGMLVTCATQVVATVASTTAGNTAVVVTSATGIAVGMSVTGSVLSQGSVVTAISGTTVTLNYVATATSTSGSLTFGCVVPSDTYITAILSSTITLSEPLAATFTSVSLDFSVAGIAPESWGGWGGLPVVLRDGSEGSFDLTNDIKVSSPDTSSNKVSGTIPWKSSGDTGISDSWDDYGVTSAGSGCPVGDVLALSWSGVKSSDGDVITTVFASWTSTGSQTSTITLATVGDASGIEVGDTVSGPGIASGTTISTIAGDTITLSVATAHDSRVAVKIGSRMYYCSFDATSSPPSLEIHSWNFYEYSWTTNTYTDYIITGDSVSGEGIPTGAKVGAYSRTSTWNKIPLVDSAGVAVTSIGLLKSRVTFGAPSFTAYSWSPDGGVNSLYYDQSIANKGSLCTDVTVTAVDCVTAPTIKMSCQRAIRATSTTVKVKLSSPTSTRFNYCYWWNGENCDIVVGASTNIGGPGWVWSEVGAVVPVSASTKVIYTTQSVVTAGQTVPSLLCSSGASQCPRGDKISVATSTSPSSSSSSSDIYYAAPSMLSSTVQKSVSGQCSASAKTGVFTTEYSGIDGSPLINIDWETTPTYDDDGKSIWSVRFLKLASRGKTCSSPTVTFSGPKIKATFSTTSDDNKLAVTEFTSGQLSPGMVVTTVAGGFNGNTTIVSCTSYTTTPATCTLNQPVASTQSVAVEVAGAACATYPTATLSCDSNDVVALPQAYTYTFNSVTGLLTDATSTTGGPLLASALIASGSSSSFYFNGPFFEGTDANKLLLACDWDSSITCPWKASQVLPEYYSYETGKYVSRVSLVDTAGKPVEFDQPQLVRYQHSGTDSNSGKSYDGTTMLLRYDGPGQLSGLPLICFDESMEEVACVTMGRQSTTNYADFVVPDDVALINIIDGRKYYAKPKTLIERYPISSDATICNSLSVASVPAPITASETVAPSGLLDSGSYPSESELEKSYFMEGKPAAVAGVTLYELQAAAV